ncbi:MAG: YraN family protein, partial [Candidatus Berkelbacteria bacterium]|nr:YraN family protein [Candidatus Berkelbacteria bacterium]
GMRLSKKSRIKLNQKKRRLKKKMTQKSQKLGNKGEEIACEFLKRQGLEIIARNYRNQMGEIDIIAKDGDILVFVEVKTKKGNELGSPEEMVGLKKQRKLKKVSQMYFVENDLEPNYRIDVIAVDFSLILPRINWLKSAVEG